MIHYFAAYLCGFGVLWFDPVLNELPVQARHDGSGTQIGFAECAPGTFDSSCRVSQNFVKVPT